MTVADELEKLDEVTERQIMKYGKAKFKTLGKDQFLEFNSAEYKMDNASIKSLTDDLDVPLPYFTRIPAELKDYTVNYFLKARKDQETAVLVNTENNSVRAFMNPQFPYVPTKKLYDVMDRNLSDVEIANHSFNDNAVELITFSPEFDSKVADSPVRAGLRLLYSDSWSVYPRFDSYICRIQCFNSAIAPIESRKFRVSKKSETEILIQAEEFIKSAVERIGPMIDGFKLLEKEKVDNWISMVKRVCEENRLPKKLNDQICAMANDPQFLATVTNQKVETMYDLVNLLTYVATHHPELTDSHREHLFAISGNIMLNNDIRCGSCGGKLD